MNNCKFVHVKFVNIYIFSAVVYVILYIYITIKNFIKQKIYQKKILCKIIKQQLIHISKSPHLIIVLAAWYITLVCEIFSQLSVERVCYNDQNRVHYARSIFYNRNPKSCFVRKFFHHIDFPTIKQQKIKQTHTHTYI